MKLNSSTKGLSPTPRAVKVIILMLLLSTITNGHHDGFQQYKLTWLKNKVALLEQKNKRLTKQYNEINAHHVKLLMYYNEKTR